MLRILAYLVLVFAVGLGFAWLADRPGEMTVTFSGYQYQVSLMVAAVILTAIVTAIMLTWWLLKSIWNSPYTISRYFRVRRRDRGYQALSTGMIAAGAGDAALARAKNREAAKLISSDQEPLIHLLDAQASLLEGDHDTARQKFQAMLEDPEMRLLGLRGLYLEAERMGERQAARHYAAQAADAAPQLGWAVESTLEERAEQGDWDGALRLADAQRSTRQTERDIANRRRAVLLTAKAMSVLNADPTTARNNGLEAIRLAPELVPAALVAGRALIRLNDVRKAARILEAIWKKVPHPEVADVYVNARVGDTPQDKLKRALKLQSLKQNNAESALAVARAALSSGDLKQARSAAESAIKLAPGEGAFLLMADIEEADTGEQGRVRQWLARALRAPRDHAWVADGFVSEHWAPFSPVSGRIDAFEWKAPVERAPQLIEQEAEDAPPAADLETLTEAKKADEVKIVEIDVTPVKADAASAKTEPEPKKPEAAADKAERPAEPKKDASTAAAAKPAPVKKVAEEEERAEADVVPFTRPPDDPGVEPEAEDEPKSRFRLF
ncbi:heme biosynthesis protein HemY [Mesorhizobium sp. Z1-4]|uniref:heme biosynthesis protein HemY n=1 Tax=Mesorhizobium sp. Z1-4 TaxID=2448478 RepID=UPI000FDA40B5|nr:heme biosynthesis protein HemY [Mesorhizobium sp. Z1-4]